MIQARHLEGKLITFEGGEGGGKTSLMSSLKEYLIDLGYEVFMTREPGGTPLGEEIRKLLLIKNTAISISAKAELLLFLAARAQHIEECILPNLAQKKVVLCDRFNDSSIAYQGHARNLGYEMVSHLCELACGEAVPYMTFFLDVDPKEGLQRSKRLDKQESKKNQGDRLESEQLAFHQKVREGFLKLQKQYPNRIFRIDAHLPLDKVVKIAKEKLDVVL